MADGFKIAFDGDEAAQLREAAKARGMEVEDFIRAVLLREVESDGWWLSDEADLAEDVAAVEDYERTGLAVPHAEVAAWLRSLTTDNPLPQPQPRKMK